MYKPLAAAVSVLFFVAALGIVAGLVPYWLTGWNMREPLAYWAPIRVVGGLLLLAGLAALLLTSVHFVDEGRGTPSPVAPTERLVVGGLYRYVRNPMYLAVLATIAGQALLLGQVVLLAYAALVWLSFAAFVLWYEEPTLLQRFGVEYEAYLHAVPAWWPRRDPWQR